MEKVTLKAYAVKHKLSLFNVMKMVNAQKLNTEVVNENGKDVTYVIVDEKSQKESTTIQENTDSNQEKNLEKEIDLLNKEVKLLRDEIEALKKKL